MAKKTVKITGIEKVMANLNKEAIKISGKSMAGCIRGGMLVRRSMSTKAPMIPVEFSNLEHSYFSTPFPSPLKPVLLIGFTASYAMAVHEREKGAKWGTGTVGEVNWTKSGSGPKFLESALKNNQAEILNEIKKSTKY